MNKIAIRKESQNFRYEIEAPLQKLTETEIFKEKATTTYKEQE